MVEQVMLAVLGVGFLIMFVIMIMLTHKKDMKNTFVYKDKQYFLLRIVKMKSPCNRKWVDAAHYVNIRTGEQYVRDIDDFSIKFITYKEYDRIRKQSKSSNK